MFEITVKPSASKELARLPRQIQVRMAKAIALVQEDPFRPRPGLDVAPLEGDDSYRLRVGHYRAIYTVEANVVRFTRFGHRSVVYR